MRNTTAVAVEFYDSPRQISGGPPFVGVRLIDADGKDCAPALCGIGYTRAQALKDLRLDVQAAGGRTDLLPLIDAALAACPAEATTPLQEASHACAQAAYSHTTRPPLNRAQRRKRR